MDYSFEEAAQRLEVSETVLLRLSQYFRIPQQSLSASGKVYPQAARYQPAELDFLKEVRERLLAGERLKDIGSTPSPTKGAQKLPPPLQHLAPLPRQENTTPPFMQPQNKLYRSFEKFAQTTFGYYKSQYGGNGASQFVETLTRELLPPKPTAPASPNPLFHTNRVNEPHRHVFPIEPPPVAGASPFKERFQGLSQRIKESFASIKPTWAS